MTHTYNITGMTCGGCVAKVKSALLMLGDVTAADVQLHTLQATISMQRHIPLQTLQDAIKKAGNHTISEDAHSTVVANDTNEADKTWWQTYKPLLLVFAFITGVSLLTAYDDNSLLPHTAMNNFMAGFFLVFAFFKLLDLRGFADSYSSYDLLAGKWYGYGFIYPFIELALGIAYLVHWQPFYTNLATIVIMGFSSIGVIRSVVHKREIQCACLGAVFNLPMSTVTIVEDMLMVAMALVGVSGGW